MTSQTPIPLRVADSPEPEGFRFPVSAMVAQESLCLAIQLLAVEPRIGGLLVQGEKGTGKSTLIRSATALFFDKPLRTLPLNATEDRLVGGVDLGATLETGVIHAAPGLMAEANGGVIYVDEINLLGDHLVDVLLDASQSQMVRVHRDGIDRVDQARFVLVGSMNPEEGALRPQLLDRFGLSVSLTQVEDVAQRVAIMETQLGVDRDPHAVLAQFWAKDQALRARVDRARRLVDQVRVPLPVLRFIADLCLNAHVAGHRADVILTMAAKAHCALDGRWKVTEDDCISVAEFVLAHRRRHIGAKGESHPNSPLEEGTSGQGTDDETANGSGDDGHDGDEGGSSQGQGEGSSAQDDSGMTGDTSSADAQGGTGERDTGDAASAPSAPVRRDDQGDAVREEAGQTSFLPQSNPPASDGDQPPEPLGDPYRVTPIQLRRDRITRNQAGRRFHSRTMGRQGRKMRAEPTSSALDLSLIDTIRAAAMHQQARRMHGIGRPDLAITIQPEDWRKALRVRKVGSCVLFVVDASGSMGAKGRMLASKGAVLSLLLDAYVRRDQVGLIAFRREGAEVLLPFTHAIERATRELATLPTGGRTPLAAGLIMAQEHVQGAMRKDPTLRPLVVVVTDGRANTLPRGWGDPNRQGAVTNLLHPPNRSDPTITPVQEPIEGASVRQVTLAVARQVGQLPHVTWVVVDAGEHSNVQSGRGAELAQALGGAYYSFTSLKRDDLVAVTHSQLAACNA